MLLDLQAGKPSRPSISPRFLELARAPDSGRAFGRFEFEFQVQFLRDSGCKHRIAWLGDLLPPGVSGLELKPDGQQYMMPAPDHSSVVIIHGAASSRLVPLMQQMASALYAKVKIALLNEATPAKRAELLSCGFDDVLDLQSRHPEARARIRAHHRRYSMSRSILHRQNLGLDSWPATLPRHYASAISQINRSMTIRERVMFALLIENFEHVVPYQKFNEDMFPLNLKDRLKSLRVAMCGMRSKVAPAFSIQSQPRVGYRLTLSEEGQQAREQVLG